MKTNAGSISAGLVVFNEEDRLESTLRSVRWCDEIIVVDKQSTDRTREIAESLGAKIIDVPFSRYDSTDVDPLVECLRTEWVLWLTASDMVTRGLARELTALISRDDFEYDIIQVPYRRHAFGIYSKHSAWFSTHHPAVCRRNVISIRHDDPHGIVAWNSKRVYRMRNNDDAVIYHLTHPDVDGLIDRHMRYAKAEASLRPQTSFWKAFREILRYMYITLVQRHFFLGGWDGFALALAFVTHPMFKFLYLWEGRRAKGRQVYSDIRERVLQDWQRNSPPPETKHAAS